jgi:hypothetical protein
MAMGAWRTPLGHLVTGEIWCVSYIRISPIIPTLPSIQVTSIGEILHHYRRSLEQHADLLDILRPHSVTFEESRDVVYRWVEEPFLEDESWDAKWEDLCVAEVDKWDSR